MNILKGNVINLKHLNLSDVSFIGDTHFSSPYSKHYKTMDKFGDMYKPYPYPMIKGIMKDDSKCLFILGDFDWATSFKEVRFWLNFITYSYECSIIGIGNHDMWAFALKSNVLYKNTIILRNTTIIILNDVILIYGIGYSPDPRAEKRKNARIADHASRFRNRIIETSHLNGHSHKEKIVLMHHPPCELTPNEDGETLGKVFGKVMPEYEEIFDEFNIDKCVYAHVHVDISWIPDRANCGTELIHTMADFHEFTPIKLSINEGQNETENKHQDKTI